MDNYKVELVTQIESSGPHTALRNTLNRITDEVIVARVTNLGTGELTLIGLTMGEITNQTYEPSQEELDRQSKKWSEQGE